MQKQIQRCKRPPKKQHHCSPSFKRYRLNIALFKRIKTVFEEEQTHLSPEQKTLQRIQSIYSQWLLNEEDKTTLREIDQQFPIDLQFGEHVLNDSNAFSMFIKDKDQLAGLPESALAMAKQMAKQKKKGGNLHWIIPAMFLS